MRLSIQLVPRGERPAVTHVVLQLAASKTATMRVPPDAEVVEIYSPPGAIRVVAESRGHGRISTYGVSRPLQLGTGTVDVVAGQRAQCKVELRGPLTVDEIERRR